MIRINAESSGKWRRGWREEREEWGLGRDIFVIIYMFFI
jgi:hypothetical protein